MHRELLIFSFTRFNDFVLFVSIWAHRVDRVEIIVTEERIARVELFNFDVSITLLRHDERALLRITRFGFKTMKDYFDGRGEKERMVDYFRVSLDNSWIEVINILDRIPCKRWSALSEAIYCWSYSRINVYSVNVLNVQRYNSFDTNWRTFTGVGNAICRITNYWNSLIIDIKWLIEQWNYPNPLKIKRVLVCSAFEKRGRKRRYYIFFKFYSQIINSIIDLNHKFVFTKLFL